MKLGEVRGIKLELHYSTLLIVLMVGIGSASFYQGLTEANLGWQILTLFGTVCGLLILFSIVLHELSHSIVAQKHGQEIGQIKLYVFGGQAQITDEVKDPKDELKMAAAGPLSSIIFGGLLVVLLFIPWNLPIFLVGMFNYVGIANLVLAGFNLVPAYPMDGGRILRAYLWKKRGDMVSATKTASKWGKYFGYFLIGTGLLEIFVLGTLQGIWSIVIGNFVQRSAKQSYQQTVFMKTLSDIEVRELIGDDIHTIPAGTKIVDAIRNYFMPYRRKYFSIQKDGEIIGVLHYRNVQEVPSRMRRNTHVEMPMIPLEEIPSISEKMDAREALKEIVKGNAKEGMLAVYDDEDNFEGILNKQDFQAALFFKKDSDLSQFTQGI